MTLKGKCEIVEMLMGLGGPFKGNPLFPRTQSRGGKCPETPAGCCWSWGPGPPEAICTHAVCLGMPEAWEFWRVVQPSSPGCKIKAKRTESLNPSTTMSWLCGPEWDI